MSVADKLLKAMTGMMALNTELKSLVKRVDKMDDHNERFNTKNYPVGNFCRNCRKAAEIEIDA